MTAATSSYDNTVQELYVTYFGRPADPGGLTNFSAALAQAGAPTDLVGLNNAYNTNVTVKALIDSFGTSAESVALYGDTSTAAGIQNFVSDIYQNLFDRAPDADGLTFWSNAILSGHLTQGDAALSIAAGAAQNSTAQGKTDAQTVANKVNVAGQFTAALQTPQDIAAYSGDAAAHTVRGLLGTVTGASDPGTFAGTIQSTIAVLVNPTDSDSFYLTTGIDHLVGNNDHDTFYAVINNAAGGDPATLNPGDSVTGTSAGNTLDLADEGAGGYFAPPTGITLTNITELDLKTNEAVANPNVLDSVFDFSKLGFTTVHVLESFGISAVKMAPGSTLEFNVTQGSVTTYGGANVQVSASASTQNASPLTDIVYGDASTTTVGVASGFKYLVQDANYGTSHINTITTVSVEAVNTFAIIDSNALDNLTATDEIGGATITVNAAAGARQLAVTLNNDANLTITDQTATVVDLSVTTTASSGMNLQFGSAASVHVAVDANLGVASLSAPDAITLSLSGSGDLDFASVILHSGAKIDASASSGAIDMNLSGSVGFIGGTGTDTITIDTLPSGPITGGSAGDSEIVFSNIANAAGALAQISNFAILGFAGATSGTFDLGTSSGIGTLDLDGISGNASFTSLPAGVRVNITNGGLGNLTLQEADSNGATDTQTVYIGKGNLTNYTVPQLTIQDAVGQGVGTLDLVSHSGQSSAFTVDTLADPGLTALNLSGPGAIDIANAIADSVAHLAIGSSAGASADYVNGVTDPNLSALALSGTTALTLGTLVTSAATLGITGSGNAGVTMAGVTDAQLTSMTITLGNGNNQLNAGGSQAIDIHLGSGINQIVCPEQGVSGQVSFAAHTAADQISVGALGSNVDLTHIIAISGLNNNGSDSIGFGDSGGASVTAGSMQQVTAADVAGDTSQLANWVAAAVGQGGLVAQTAHGVNWFQFGGNTYLVETPSASDAGVVNASDTVVELVGQNYTFTNAATVGTYLQLKG